MDTWNAALYDSRHQFVSIYGEGLLALLKPKAGEFILDVGCGTGDLTVQIAEADALVMGIDQSAAMIQQAKEKYPEVEFSIGDVRNLDYVGKFDAVFSNAVLHWVKPAEAALKSIYSSLKPGGRFVAEFGGQGNIQSVLAAVQIAFQKLALGDPSEKLPWYFPSLPEYVSLLARQGFNVQYAEIYDRPTPLQGEDGMQQWLKMFCGDLLENLPGAVKEEVLTEMEAALYEDQYQEGHWVLDYRRLRIMASK